jgi:DNA-directed RNA polymerase specialized sigma24 family protein
LPTAGGDTSMDPFDSLLEWLDSDRPDGPYDRERAALKYERIRRRLIKFFTCRGCPDADVLADVTFERVTEKVPEIAPTYKDDPARYVSAVAKKILLESLRKRPGQLNVPPPAPPSQSEEVERVYGCLERCMDELTQKNRDLILDYYRNDKRAKIDGRKELADALGIAQNALRIRAHRIRTVLESCVRGCVESALA